MPTPHTKARGRTTARQCATLKAIRSFRGIFKRKPGEKLATQELLEDRAEDLRLEEAKWNRFEKRLRHKPKLPSRPAPHPPV